MYVCVFCMTFVWFGMTLCVCVLCDYNICIGLVYRCVFGISLCVWYVAVCEDMVVV